MTKSPLKCGEKFRIINVQDIDEKFFSIRMFWKLMKAWEKVILRIEKQSIIFSIKNCFIEKRTFLKLEAHLKKFNIINTPTTRQVLMVTHPGNERCTTRRSNKVPQKMHAFHVLATGAIFRRCSRGPPRAMATFKYYTTSLSLAPRVEQRRGSIPCARAIG